MRAWIASIGMMVTTFSSLSAFAAFQPPKDGVYSEKQLQTYIAEHNQLSQYLQDYARAGKDEKDPAKAVAIVNDYNQKCEASYAKNGTSQEEYDWMNTQVGQAWTYLLWEAVERHGLIEAQKALKESHAKLDAAKQKLATAEAAQKSGKRIMTDNQKQDAAASAKDQQQQALDDAKTHADEAKSAGDEAAQHEKDAKAADDLAANPPADVSADDKASYIEGKKKEASDARDAAKESRAKEAEAHKAEAAARAKAAVAAAKMANPDVPTTDEEKAQLKQENDAAVAAARKELTEASRQAAFQKEAVATTIGSLSQLKGNPPASNVELLHKHLDEMKDTYSRELLQEVEKEGQTAVKGQPKP